MKNERDEDQPSAAPRESSKKKPYVRPRIVDEAPFEGLALACAHFTVGTCGGARS